MNVPYQRFYRLLSILLTLIVPNGAPLNLMVIAAGSNTLVGSWEPPSPEHRNGEILRYTVTVTLTARGGAQVTNGEPRVLHTAHTNFTVGSLHPHYTYSYSVAAVNSEGTGPSTMVTVMMPEAGKDKTFNREADHYPAPAFN